MERAMRTSKRAGHLVVVSAAGADRHAEPAREDVVKELDSAYDKWWDSVQPQLVNENAVGPKVNPFKALYWKQFGHSAGA